MHPPCRPALFGPILMLLSCNAALGCRAAVPEDDDEPAPTNGVPVAMRSGTPRSGSAIDAPLTERDGPSGAGRVEKIPAEVAPDSGVALTSVSRADAASPASPDVASQSGIVVQFKPADRTFSAVVDVVLMTDDPLCTIRFTVDDSAPTDQSPVYKDPIRLSKSTVIRAVAIKGSVKGPVANQAFLKLEPDVLDFSSDLPLLVVSSGRSRVTKKADGTKAASALIFEPEARSGRTTLRGLPALDTRVGIKVHGSSSETFDKKSYKLELWGGGADEDVSTPILGMPAESDWILFGPFAYDRAMIRNSVMYALSNQIGRWAPRTRFVEIFYADQGRGVAMADYQGVYVLVEKIKVGKSRLAITKLGPTDISPATVTGGYIIKVDRLNDGEKGLNAGLGPDRVFGRACPVGVKGACGIGTPDGIGFMSYSYPDEAQILKIPAQATYLNDTLNTFANALAKKEDVSALIDQPAWIDHHILQTLSKNMDAHRLSAYFHKDRGGKIAAGPIWDFDRTLGCNTDKRCVEPTWWDSTNFTMDCSSTWSFGWWAGLFADPAFRAAYFARFRVLIDAEFSVPKLHALIDDVARQLGTEAPLRNFARWKIDAPVVSHTAEIVALKDWLARRVTWLRGCLSLPDPRDCRGN